MARASERTTEGTELGRLTVLVERLIRQFDGNGQPGIVERMTVMEQKFETMAAALTETTKSSREGMEFLRAQDEEGHEKILRRLDEQTGLTNTLQTMLMQHLRTDNPEHETIAKAWQRNPLGVVKTVGLVLAVFSAGIATGFLDKFVALFTTLAGH